MGGFKRLACLVMVTATPLAAFNGTADQQLHFFASCAGRLSATMEHQWNHDTASADQTKSYRTEMIDLVTAVMPADRGRDVLLMRVEAKHAQARLLRRTVINRDPVDADWALSRAEAMLRECTSVLMSASAD